MYHIYCTEAIKPQKIAKKEYGFSKFRYSDIR